MPFTVTTMNGLFDAEYFDIESSHVGDTFRVFVGKPATVDPEKSYPVIYTLDGNASFASLIGTQRLLMQGGQIPPAFVIGIGYPGETLWTAMANRNRDYAPTAPGEAEARLLGVSTQAGGPAFLRFIQEELKPLLVENYPVNMSNGTVHGISLGGLFAVWTLFTTPTTFKNYILGSPAIWWRNEQVWEWEEAFFKAHDDLPATVFIGTGMLEVQEHMRADALRISEASPIMREHVERMIAWSDEHGWPETAKLTPKLTSRLQSRAYRGLRIHNQIMPDENHMSVPPAITSRGLRYVFGNWRP